MIRQITVLSQGEASSAKTWSNIPFFLTNALKEKGYEVNTVNINGGKVVRFIYDKFFCRLLRFVIHKDTTYCYDRTTTFQRAVDRQMMDVVKEYPDTDLFISTSFSFSPKEYTDEPCTLLCDWTYDYLIEHFKGREPDRFERKGIELQKQVISEADYVISLFPDVAKYMKKRYPETDVEYLGNVINSPKTVIQDSVLAERRKVPRVIFVGLPKYREGLRSLCEAIQGLEQEGIEIGLDVVGMDKGEVPFNVPKSVTFHGYLDKSNDNEAKAYYSLLNNAIAFINTTPKWAGFSSTLEAMYHGLPVLTSEYESFTETFGESISFGDYSRNNTPEETAAFIHNILDMNDNDYLKMCHEARKASEPYTWAEYVDKIIDQVTKKNR